MAVHALRHKSAPPENRGAQSVDNGLFPCHSFWAWPRNPGLTYEHCSGINLNCLLIVYSCVHTMYFLINIDQGLHTSHNNLLTSPMQLACHSCHSASLHQFLRNYYYTLLSQELYAVRLSCPSVIVFSLATFNKFPSYRTLYPMRSEKVCIITLANMHATIHNIPQRFGRAHSSNMSVQLNC